MKDNTKSYREDFEDWEQHKEADDQHNAIWRVILEYKFLKLKMEKLHTESKQEKDEEAINEFVVLSRGAFPSLGGFGEK